MKLKKNALILGALIAGSVYAVSAIAIPPPPGDDDYVIYYHQYYTDATKTVEAGVRVISNGSECGEQRYDHGVVTPYSRLIVESCGF
jgi:hypothetical protein